MRPEGWVSSAAFEDSAEPARITTAASSTASGSSLARNAGVPPISVNVPDSSSAPATIRNCAPSAVSPSTSRTSLPSSVSPPTRAIVSANLSLRIHFGSVAQVAPQTAADADRDAARDVDGRKNHQHRLRPVNDSVNHAAHYNQNQ